MGMVSTILISSENFNTPDLKKGAVNRIVDDMTQLEMVIIQIPSTYLQEFDDFDYR